MLPLLDRSVFEAAETGTKLPAIKIGFDLVDSVNLALDNEEFWDEVAEENEGFIPLHENDLEDVALVMPPSGGWA